MEAKHIGADKGNGDDYSIRALIEHSSITEDTKCSVLTGTNLKKAMDSFNEMTDQPVLEKILENSKNFRKWMKSMKTEKPISGLGSLCGIRIITNRNLPKDRVRFIYSNETYQELIF